MKKTSLSRTARGARTIRRRSFALGVLLILVLYSLAGAAVPSAASGEGWRGPFTSDYREVFVTQSGDSSAISYPVDPPPEGLEIM